MRQRSCTNHSTWWKGTHGREPICHCLTLQPGRCSSKTSFFFFSAISSLKITRREKSERCHYVLHIEMPTAVPRCRLSSLQFSSSWTRRQKHLQSLARMVCTSQGAVWADSQKLPGSCRLLHRICIGLADGEEAEKMNDPTTDLTDVCWQQPSEKRLRDLLVYHLYIRVCSKPTHTAWALLGDVSAQFLLQVSNKRGASVPPGKSDQNIFTVWKPMYF